MLKRPSLTLLFSIFALLLLLIHGNALAENNVSAIKKQDTLIGAAALNAQPQPAETVSQANELQKAETPQSDQYIEHAGSLLSPQNSNPVAVSAVNKSISLFAERIRERFAVYLERSGKYLEMMQEVLREKNVPEDMVFLSLIESGFNPHAYSVARAVGPWQFISSTAKRYGLKIDWWRDERKDPVKSTAAAANYLSDLYEMFGSWNLAMAAYNAGEGRILKALNRTGSDDYWALLSTRHIKSETKQYVPRFIAAGMIASNPQEYGFENLEYHSPFEYDEVILDNPVDIDVIAVCAGSDVAVIRDLNPELRRWSTPPNVHSYKLRIPAGKKEAFIANLSTVPHEDKFTIATYIVKKGDTIKKIAGKAGVPVSAVLELNNGVMAYKAGEKIYLPPKDKFYPDRDDKVMLKKAAYKSARKKGKTRNKKILVTSLNKKETYIND